MSMLQHPALTRLWYGGQPGPNTPNQNQIPNSNPNVYPAHNPNPNSNFSASTISLPSNNAPERSHSPHSVDGSIVRTRRKNRERRGTENSLPVTFDATNISGDIGEEFRKEGRQEFDKPDHGLLRKDNIGVETRRQAKLDIKADYQVPFPQVQDMAAVNSGSKGRRTGAPQPVNSNEQRDWEREQALRFYNQQLAQHLPSAPSPSHTLQQQGYRASPPPLPLPSTGSPQARAAPAGSPSQPPRPAYAPPPPTMASSGPGSSNGSIESYEVPPTLTSRSSFMTNATANPLPTLPDSPPSPEPANLADILRSPPYVQQPLGHVGGVQTTGLGGIASILQAQQVPISPLHPRPTNRTQAGVLGPTKMAETWTAAPPPEELDDEVRERNIHLGGARDGATQRDRGHRGTGGGSVELKDGSWVQAQALERQGSVRRPKPATQVSMSSVPAVQTQQQAAPTMTRTSTMPITRYETMSPPPIRDTHGGLHLDLHDNKSVPEKPQPAPSRPAPGPGRGPSPVPMQSPNGPRGRETTRAPGATHSYDDQTYGRGRSTSHNTYTQPKAPPPPPPVSQNQWSTRAPGTGIVPFNEDLDHDEHEQQPAPPLVQQPMLPGKSDQSIVDWANHTQSQHPLTHPNQPQPVPPGLGPIPPAPTTAATGERARGRSRSRGRGDQTQVQAPLMDPASMYSQQNQNVNQNVVGKSPEINGARVSGGRSPAPAIASTVRGNAGSGSSEAEDLKTPRSPSVPLPNDNYPRFGYGQFSVGHPGTINHIYPQDLGQNGQMYSSMGFAQSQYALRQMGAGPQGMMGQMNGYHMNGQNGQQVNGRDVHNQGSQNGYYGYPQDLSSSASGSFLDGWTSNQMDGRGYPTHTRPSAPVPPTPSSGTAPTSISGEIRSGTQGQIARAQTVLYNAQSQLHPQQAYPPYNYAQAQMSYAMDPYRAPSVVSSFMASPFSHNPFLPPLPEPQSTQSSPSHQPLGLPYVPGPTTKRFGGARMGTKSMGRRRRMMEEFRPESTVPNDTASEAETEGKRARDDGTETEFETETEMEEVWLEESDDDELDNEFHPTYFVNPAKRKRRFEQKWEQMVKLFREIDRETDATMILAAAPPDQHQTHL
ncbi:hypothetical protein FRC06_004405, partial [Ceratobasidium sp. 370]